MYQAVGYNPGAKYTFDLEITAERSLFWSSKVIITFFAVFLSWKKLKYIGIIVFATGIRISLMVISVEIIFKFL